MAGRTSEGHEVTGESPFLWEEKVHIFEIPYVPKPQSRPRVTSKGTYNPDAKEIEALHWQLKAQRKVDTLEGPLAVTIVFVYPNPQRRKMCAPATRPDVDNLAKKILDSANNCIWFDDSQIVELRVIKRYLTQ